MNNLLIKSSGLAMGTQVLTPNGETLKGVTKIVINPIEVGGGLVTATITVIGVRLDIQATVEVLQV